MEIVFTVIIVLIIVDFLVFLFLITPNKKRVIPVAKAYAHRGLHDKQTPENSLSAFKKASENRFGVEFDVQLTKDKQIVVFHDESLLRMTGMSAEIIDLTYNELCKYGLNNTDEKIPLLREVLIALDGVPILCEIKKQRSNTNIEICPYLVGELDEYQGDICIESFSPFILKWFKEHRPDFARGQLSADFIKTKGELKGISALFMKNLLLNFFGRPDFIAYKFTDASIGLLFIKKFFHTPVLGWTARGEEEREICRQDFDGEIFEINS